MDLGTPAVPDVQSQSAVNNASAIPSSNSSKAWIESFMGENPYFQAGFGLMGVGVLLGGIRQLAVFGNIALRRRLLVSVELNNKDRAYPWVLEWMAHNQNKTKGRFLPKSHRLSVETTVHERKNGSSSVLFNLVAGTGMHWMKYRGAWMQVVRERETQSIEVMSGTPWETVTITTLSKDRNIFPLLLAEARDLAMRENEGKLVIYTAWGTDWRQFGQPRRKRPLSSVVLDSGIREKIEGDVKTFLDRRRWYADRGIPYRRGYLLHGPPGSGKSSFIQALAGSLHYDICLLNLSERGLGDDKLNHLLSNVPERSFVLIEDVDAAFNKRVQTSEDGYQSSVTFSGFLNALDGVASGEERIIFLTTNHLERLDPALVRPGRVDLLEYIGDATPDQARTMFDRFYGTEGDEVVGQGNELKEIVRRGVESGQRISMAALQGLFIRYGESSKDAVEACRSHFAPEK
ncbi:Complex III assembly protein translocase and chaperone [Marasmius crinis-equi]|uniref:Complex III assembly protein translocase and chaperone n=1 Tax=Marasmius crinis-equi TaxID=585013 RepID=A0ABR3FCF4_9AGAR